MNTFRYFDIMERYARGPMTAEERTEFERLLQQDRDLAGEWADYQLIARSVRSTLRSKMLSSPDIGQLVRDARDLAQSEGLLFTDEDIWDHVRGLMPLERSVVFERRMRTDAIFAAQVAGQKILIESIQNFAQRQKSIDKVRDTLRNQGFTGELHRQIEQDIAEEKRRSLPPFESKPDKKNGGIWWLALFGLLAITAAAYFFLQEKPAVFDLKSEIEQIRRDLPGMAVFQKTDKPDVMQAARFLAQNLPDAALTHLHMVPQEQRAADVAVLEGLAFMEKGDFKAALPALNSALQAGQSELSPTAFWLAALCCFELRQYAEAEGHLQGLLSNRGSTEAQRAAAHRLLARLP